MTRINCSTIAEEISELDVVLQELEHAERFKPTEVRGATPESEATRY